MPEPPVPPPTPVYHRINVGPSIFATYEPLLERRELPKRATATYTAVLQAKLENLMRAHLQTVAEQRDLSLTLQTAVGENQRLRAKV